MTAMQNLYASYPKELAPYFCSPVAYILIGVFLIVAGFFFNIILASAIQSAFSAEMQSMRFGAPADFDVPGAVLRSFLGLMSTLVLFVSPLWAVGVCAGSGGREHTEL